MENALHRTSTGGSDEQKADGAALTAVVSASSMGSSKLPPTTKFGPRSPSQHSLLAANLGADIRQPAHAQTNKISVERSSTSMPPPITKPNADRRLSASLASMRSPRKSEDGYRSPSASVKSYEERPAMIQGVSAPISTTATDASTVTTSSLSQLSGLPLLSPPEAIPATPNSDNLVPRGFVPAPSSDSTAKSDAGSIASSTLPADTALPARTPRVNTARTFSTNNRRLSSTKPRPEGPLPDGKQFIGTVGVCALDVKARSRPSRQILTRIQDGGEFEVVVFGDKAILDEAVENWPICDFLIAFFSDGFPLDKAIAYVKLRKPFVVNDLSMQKVLWDRRLCLKILDQLQVPTPKRMEVCRDGGPKLESTELALHVKNMSGVTLLGPSDGTGGGAPMTQSVSMADNGDTLVIDGKPLRKPFVEKPTNGEDHNVTIYFPKSHEGGGARRLFRKIGNKSSEYDADLITPRCITEEGSSYIYEQFLKTENAEDVKAYTVGPDFCHAETRKSPVVDGLVRRNTHGKELRYVTKLSAKEKEMAARISKGFGQRVCGFDMLRTGNKSYVIDVNGWSFVKDNENYYNNSANILKAIFSAEKFKSDGAAVVESVESTSETGRSRTNTNTTHSHRNALKTILKSPSMTKLSAHLPHSSRHQAHGTESPRSGSMTVPLSSPPSLERNHLPNIVPMPKTEARDTLPAPTVPETSNDVSSTIGEVAPAAPLPNSKHSWKLKGVVTVIRHADRTPKQKLKFTAHSQVFVDLLKGHHEEVLLKGEAALASVEAAVKTALTQNLESLEKLRSLRNALAKKANQPGTKVQIKPMFRKRKPDEMPPDGLGITSSHQLTEQPIPEDKEVPTQETPKIERSGSISADSPAGLQHRDSISGVTFSRFAAQENDLILDKLQLVMKWGGEPTHSARYQSQDLGTNMRDDFKLLNREVLDDVRIFTSSEKRVKTSAQIFAAAFLGQQDIPEDFISVRKDLLDDSNAAKDVMDKVKKKLKHLLRAGNSVPEQFAWPKDVAEPYVVMQTVIDLLKFHRKVMRHNLKKLNGGAAASLAALNVSGENKDNKEAVTVGSIQSRWCTGEDPELFKERWEKLFSEFCDNEKADPSKVSELYDTMKYDALHNKQFLEWVFTPSQSIIDEIGREEGLMSDTTSPESEKADDVSVSSTRHNSVISATSGTHNIAHKLGFRRRSVLTQPPLTPPPMSYEQDASYFKLFGGSGDSVAKQDKRLGRLRELYRYAKILFDYICPQEYGISDHEKLEIGLLTSLPLLREIVQDLEELQASGEAKSFIYFTKESHIYTLLNCIMEGGISTKIKRASIPELDYLSQICFELYEARDEDAEESTYSIRISISPGCHTIDPLDVSLDSKHAIGSAPRRSLTNHQNWKEVISTLKAKFNTVELPKSFLAVNVSDKHEEEMRQAEKAGKVTGAGTDVEMVTDAPLLAEPEEEVFS